VPAALYMAKLGSDMRTLAFTETSPAVALMKMNDLLAKRSRRGMFATLLYIELNASTGSMIICNAGHLPPIVKRADGTLARLAGASGAPLGMMAGMNYIQETAKLEQGETVVLYTDGIIEAMNAREELFGYDRLEAIMKQSSADPGALKEAVISEVNRFTGLSPQHDDMTLVCFGAVK